MINFNSPGDLSRLFFGGVIKTKEPEPVLNELGQPVVIKTGKNRGQIKTKLQDTQVIIKGLKLIPKPEWATKKPGVYSVNEKVLQEIASYEVAELDDYYKPFKIAKQIATLMLVSRGKEKLLGTYYLGWKKYIHTDGLVHANFSHCGYEDTQGNIGGGSQTGRLSSNKPNSQQVPR